MSLEFSSDLCGGYPDILIFVRISNAAIGSQLVMKMPDKRHRAPKGKVKSIKLVRMTERGREEVGDIVVKESPLTIVLNGTELVTLLCTPTKLKELAVGFLFSEGLLDGKKDIKRVTVDRKRGVAWVESSGGKKITGDFLARRYITTGCGKGTSFMGAEGKRNIPKVKSEFKVTAKAVLTLMSEFQNRSDVHRLTGGVHNAALCNPEGIMLFSEDIGRHSAIDKIIGECLLKNIDMGDCLVITSGRISSEVLLKIAMAGVPMIVSKSAPTDLAIKLAKQSGITLVGFVRGKRMNVYSNGRRVVTSPRLS